ncbi:helix-turn-helix domain-containing protein [Aquimarina algiphila]|uniref:helix-turn-helix domain-containing protein n=1 Tax=Aquimarina algiphila TaxID=2047982 RepID=UPI00248FECF9|nr:helix-turn-helix domain-containing protein [Aquimarina algiphila]
MKKYSSFFLRFIAILNMLSRNIFITNRISNNLNLKPNILNINIKQRKNITLLVYVFFAFTFFTLIILGNIKLLPNIFLILLLSFSGVYLYEYETYNFTSLNKPKTPENNKILKKSGAATFAKINEYVLTEKKYLSPEINLHSIAMFFDISKGYISQLINVHAEKSFNDYINELRFEDSKKMLLDHHYNHYTIESIGLECGFKSKSNFYTTFKKFSGLTPNQYKKQKNKF